MPEGSYRLKVTTPGAREAKRELTTLRNIAAGLGVTLGGLALGRAFVQSVGLIKDFEFSMARVRAISGATGDEFRALNERARTLGATTVFSARQAADGMIFLSQAGFTAKETMQAVGDALTLAQAGALGLAEAADITAKAIRIFGLAASESGRIADVLAKAAASSNTNVSQLGQALTFVGPTAAALNITLEQSVALIGVLSDRGLQATRAGTGLRRVFSALLKPTSDTAKEMEALGVNVEGVANSLKSGDVLGAFRGLGSALDDAAFSFKIFGDRGAGAALNIGNNLDAYVKLRDALRAATGAGREMADVMNDTLRGSFLSLRSATEEWVLRLGDDSGLTGGLKSLVRTIAGAVSVQNGMLKQFRQSNKLSAAQVESIKTLSRTFDLLRSVLILVAGRFVFLRAKIIALNSVIALTALSTGRLVTQLAFLARILRVLKFALAVLAIDFFTRDVTILTGRIDEMGRAVKIQISRWREWAAVIKATFAGFSAFIDLDPRTTFQSAFNKSLAETFKALEEGNRIIEESNVGQKAADALNESSEAITKSKNKITEDLRDLANEFVLLDARLQPISEAILSGKIDTEGAEALLDTYRNFLPVFRQYESSLEMIDQQLNKQNISLEQAKQRQIELRKEYENLLENQKRLLNVRKELDNQLNSGLITIREFRRRTALLTGAYREQTEEIQKVAEEYRKTSDVIKREADKQKRSIESVLNTLNSVTDALDSIFGRFDDKAELESEQRAINQKISELQKLRREEAGRDEPDRSAIATFDSRILDAQQDLIRVQSKLSSQFNDVTLGFRIAGDLVDPLTEVAKLFLGRQGGGSFQRGGIVPGRPGQSVPVTAHAGEAIFNPRQLDNLNSLLSRRGNVNIRILNQSGQQLTAQEKVTQNPLGELNIELLVRNMVQSEIARGSFDGELLNRYDLSRT